MSSDSTTLRQLLVQSLEALQRSGVTHLPQQAMGPVVPVAVGSAAGPLPAKGSSAGRDDDAVGRPGSAPVQPTVPTIVAASGEASSSGKPRHEAEYVSPAMPAVRIDGPNLPQIERQGVFERLCTEVRECRKCPVLVANRTQTVFGVGCLTPRLVFFGEAPGADEDEQGEPFVGRAGQLLDKMIAAMTLERSDVYILNVLKCRPPGNRPPDPDEAENCRPFFERQIEVLRPEFICCLGASAAQALLRTKLSIGKLRGRLLDYGAAKVMPTYHPSYLLRNPSAKKYVWDDLQILMAAMGLRPA